MSGAWEQMATGTTGGRPKREGTVYAFNGDNQGSFDPTKVYPKSEDGKGHGQSIRTNMPKDVVGAIASAVESDPRYKSQGDFIRTWSVHGLNYIADHSDDPAYKAAVRKAAMIMEMERQAEGRKDDFRQVARFGEMFQELKNNGEWELLIQAMTNAEDAMSDADRSVRDGLRDVMGNLKDEAERKLADRIVAEEA